MLVAVVALLGGCDTVKPWFSEEEPPPLPGKRVSVLLHEQVLTPDPKVAAERILLPPPTVNRDWPQAGGYANHAMHHIEVADGLSRAWRADIGQGADDAERFVSSPIVARGGVFAMDTATNVSAFVAETGERLWEAELTPEEEDEGHIGGGLAYESSRVVVTTGFAQVIALDAATGAEIWRRDIGSPMRTPPTLRGGRVFAVTVDNKLNVLDAASGDTLWTHTGIAEIASILGGGSPAVDAGVVVVPYSSGELVALKVENGRVLWTDSLAAVRRTDVVSTLAHIRGRPIIDRGRVIAISHGGLMVAIDLRSGQRIWDKEIGGLESPWVVGNYIYVMSNEGKLICLSRDAARVHWVQQLPRWEDPRNKRGPILWSGPILVSDRLIVAGSKGEALAISPYSGQIIGKVEMPDNVSVAPIAANGSVYFLSDNAELVAYR
jgi:outer membrane protein assembly factor BamB